MSTAVIYSKRTTKIDIDFDKFEIEDIAPNEAFGLTTVYFIGPKEPLSKIYPKCESTEISVEFLTEKPHGSYPCLMISPTKNGTDYNWNDLYIEDYEAVHNLIDIGLKKLEEIKNIETRKS